MRDAQGDAGELRSLKDCLKVRSPEWVSSFVDLSGLEYLLNYVIKTAAPCLVGYVGDAAAAPPQGEDDAPAPPPPRAGKRRNSLTGLLKGAKLTVRYSEVQAEAAMDEGIQCVANIMNNSSGMNVFETLLAIVRSPQPRIFLMLDFWYWQNVKVNTSQR